MELSLDLSLAFVPKTVSVFLADLSRTKDTSQKLTMLDDFVSRLEDEMRKVVAFKRELPLCMLLLNDAIARLKDEKVGCMRMLDSSPPPVAQQLYMPLKTNQQQQSYDNKKNWMSSVQLWTTQTKQNKDDDRSVPENPNQQGYKKNNNNGGGAFVTSNGNSYGDPSFTLVTPLSEELSHTNSKSGCGGGSSSGSSLLRVEIQSQSQPPQPLPQHQSPRKQRRCWSPELHRRFVDALQQLGGPHVATPKQIRELMQVDGLTNDEVKSHLQKYRLHVRRFPVSQNSQANNNNDRVFWMSQDECGDDDKSKGNLSSHNNSGSPKGPLTPLLLGGSVKGLSSPGRNSMDAEDEQSDCRNWKSGIQDQQHHHHEADNHSL